MIARELKIDGKPAFCQGFCTEHLYLQEARAYVEDKKIFAGHDCVPVFNQ